jgi:hypothetical protein
VLGAGHRDARVGVDPQDLGLDDEEVPGRARSHVDGTGLRLQRAFGDPGRPDHGETRRD